MAVAKCRIRKAPVTVRMGAGAVIATAGDSFRSRCEEHGSPDDPGSCLPMREAVARAAIRAEREATPLTNPRSPSGLAPA